MANFGISEKIEKIETFISENLKIFGYDLNFLIWTPLARYIESLLRYFMIFLSEETLLFIPQLG